MWRPSMAVLGPDEGRGHRCRRTWRAGERGVSRAGRNADDALAGVAAEPERSRGVHAAYAAGIPTGRYALPEEIAGAVLYLCSDLSGDVTGTHIVIDGGRSGSGGVAPVKRQ